MKAKLGPDHPDTLESMDNLADSYHAWAGTPRPSSSTRRRCLEKAKLGPDHPDTLTSMHDLAFNCRDAGQRDRALKLYEESLPLRKAKLGPDDPITLRSMDDLAFLYNAPASVPVPSRSARRLWPEEGQARPRPPRHADEHEQPGQSLDRRRPQPKRSRSWRSLPPPIRGT